MEQNFWGSEPHHQIEQVHIKFCTFILGFGQSAHSSAALGECGRLPLYIQYEERYVKYWFKSLKIPENSMLYLSYKIRLQLDKHHKKGLQILSNSYFQVVLAMCGLARKLVPRHFS